MDNGTISKAHQEINLPNSKQIAVLRTKAKSNQVENSGKQATQNSDSDKPQNKFDLPSFKCNLCSYESIWKHAVKRHQQTHYKVQVNSKEIKKAKYKCETCSYTTNNWLRLKVHHEKLHVKKIKNDASRKEDLFTLTRKEQIRESKSNKESNKIDIYRCKICKYKTNYKVIFESHEKVHLQNTGEEVFWCDLCTFSSLYRQSFLRHMRTIHKNKLSNEDDIDSIEKFEQHEEKKKVANQSGRNIENATYPQSDNPKYMCENNNVPSQNSNPMKSHEVTTDSLGIIVQKPIAKPRRGKYSDVPVKTTKNGLFECEHCSYQTAIRTALVKHQTNHLKNANS